MYVCNNNKEYKYRSVVSFLISMPLHWPGYRYLGPGTKDLSVDPVNSTDAIAREHDLAYANKNTSDNDVFNSDKEAISKFWTNFKETKRPSALAGAAGLGVKNLVEEHMLGTSLYGKRKAPPTEKNWGQIKRINSARAQRRMNEDMANNNMPDAAAFNSTEPMEAMADAPAAGGSGMGGSLGGGGNPMGDIYGGTSQNANYITLEYNKSYHFTITNKLPEWRRTLVDDHVEYQTRYNSIHGIPWEMLAMYMSEGEIERLDNYSFVKVEEVTCQVYSMGVRLPFYTGQTVSQVANSNAQYPIGKFNFDRDFITSYEEENVTNVVSKCLGSEWRTGDVTETAWNSNFPNLTASSTSRDINNPIVVHYPRLSWFVNPIEQWPKDVGIYDYCQIKNGSTAYGLMFSETWQPKEGILYAVSDTVAQGSLYPLDSTTQSEFNVIPGEASQFIAGTNTITTRQNANFNLRTWVTSRARHFRIGIDSHVDGNPIFGVGDTKTQTRSMPKFLLGFVNVRNKDDTILEANWDIMVKCFIKLKCVDNGQRGFVSRYKRPSPYVMNPFIRWQNTDVGTAMLTPSGKIKSGVYGKRTLRQIPSVGPTSKEMITKLNETAEGKEQASQLKQIITKELNHLKKLKERNKHPHAKHDEMISHWENALKNF